MQELITFFTNQSVAIAMLVYFVARFEKILQTNTESLKILADNVARCPKNAK